MDWMIESLFYVDDLNVDEEQRQIVKLSQLKGLSKCDEIKIDWFIDSNGAAALTHKDNQWIQSICSLGMNWWY